MGQHRVSEFYLRGFAQQKGRRVLFEYDKTTGFTQEISPKKASAARRLFVVEGPDENAVETFLGAVETRAKPVFDKLRNELPLEPRDYVALCQFIAMAYVRSPRVSEHFEHIRSLFTPESALAWLRTPRARIAWLLDNPRRHATEYDAEISKYAQDVAAGRIDAPGRPPINCHFRLLEYQKEWIQTLLGLTWHVEIAENGDFFVIGDEPLCVRRPGSLFEPRYVPIASRDAEISVPLNRRMCLIGRCNTARQPLTYVRTASSRVEELNHRTVFCAHRLFWSRAKDERCDAYIAEVSGRSIVVNRPRTLEEFFNEPQLL